MEKSVALRRMKWLLAIAVLAGCRAGIRPGIDVAANPPVAIRLPPDHVERHAAPTAEVQLAGHWQVQPTAIEDPPPVPAHAQRALQLADLEAIALAQNPTLAEAGAKVAAAQGNWVQVGLPPNPGIGYSGQQLGSGGQAEQHGVILEQQFITGGKLRLNRAVASHEVAKAEQLFVAQRHRVLTDVRQGYYEVLSAQRRIELTEQLVDISKKAAKVADSRLKIMEGSRIDLLQARIEADAAEVQLERSRNQHLEAWRRLAAVLGVPGMTPARLEGDLTAAAPATSWEAAWQRLLSESPEMAAAAADVQRARWAVHRAQAEVCPDVSVQGIVQDDRAIRGTDGALQVVLPLPLINRNQGGIAKAYSELAAADLAQRRVELNLQRRLAVVFQRYQSARVQAVRYSRDILPNAKENLDLARKGYEGGEFDFLNLLMTQRTYAQTNLDYVEALRALWSAMLEMDGLLLAESLEAGR